MMSKNPLWNALAELEAEAFESIDVRRPERSDGSTGKLFLYARLKDGTAVDERFLPETLDGRVVLDTSRFDGPEYEWLVTEALRREGHEFVTHEARLRELFENGLSASEAVDYLNTVEGDYTQTKWAWHRNVSQQTVSENVAKARAKLADA